MKRRVRLTESDLHRIVEESVNRVLKEYTNGFTEKLYNNLTPKPGEGNPTVARKRLAQDYLSDRFKRENGLSDEQIDSLVGSADDMYNAKVPGTVLKRHSDGENERAARNMAYNLKRRRPKPEVPQEPEEPQMPPKKKGLKGRFFGGK